MNQLLIIGDSVFDKIYYNGILTERPGGIFHTINTLVHLAEPENEFYLATHYSEKSFKYFKEIYSKINLTFSELVDEIPTVTLHLFDDKERKEKYSGTVKPIFLPEKLFALQYNLILVNMITGFDITPDDLFKLKTVTKAEVYFDVHTLSRKFAQNGERPFRAIPSVENWLKGIDILQLNQNEIKMLWGINSEKENIKKLLENNINKVIVTKGDEGVSLYYNGTEKFFPAKKVNAINFVGCGDSFGAAFSFLYSKNKDLFSAVDFGNFVAGIITTYDSFKKHKRLKNDIAKRYN